ncbi:MAG: precorrin-4 C(11)-methyltransferase [Tannerellaceae bacterium]|nr:precorrin-4 C(11)-methyltransferase [Tannerellaceae bacterium]
MSAAIILISESSLSIARRLQNELPEAKIYTRSALPGCIQMGSVQECTGELFPQVKSLIFIGAMGICVRNIAPYIQDKYTDPAVINMDSTGKYVIPVLSGHIGGANELARQIAHLTGGEAVITTQSDRNDLWTLDTLAKTYHWTVYTTEKSLNVPIIAFVNEKPVALLLDIKDRGTDYLERTCPAHVDIYYQFQDIDFDSYELLIAVTPYLYPEVTIPVLYYHPPVLHIGIGCRKDCRPEGVAGYIEEQFRIHHLALAALKDISTIDLKKDEKLLSVLQSSFGDLPVRIYMAEELRPVSVPNPSRKVEEVTSVPGVSEPAAIKSANGGRLILEKQKGSVTKGNEFTFAVAIQQGVLRGKGHVEIVGAGPGDPELVSVRGRRFLENADLILYAGSLVPVELTWYAKEGATVISSASMDLEEQFKWMKEFYDKGLLVVRLHTGDPCIYGAIQEQMAFFDQYQMSYHITPGISSFQAAAAALRSQFTIPEKVQTIILTRGEGRTPMPEKEKLSLLARSQSTMCIFLSAGIVEEVQRELLEHYPAETPVAACYKLTWKDERIYTGKLKDLANIIKENQLTLTTMIVVGEAIGNRQGLSRLYATEFSHLFR